MSYILRVLRQEADATDPTELAPKVRREQLVRSRLRLPNAINNIMVKAVCTSFDCQDKALGNAP